MNPFTSTAFTVLGVASFIFLLTMLTMYISKKYDTDELVTAISLTVLISIIILFILGATL